MSDSSGSSDERSRERGRPSISKVPDFVKDIVENVVIPPLLYGCGYSEAELARPRIGIANTWTELNPGHVHLDGIADRVREGIRNAGMTPFGFNTIAPCDGISEGHEGMHYILPAREVIADSVEIMAKVNRLQGLVRRVPFWRFTRILNTRHWGNCSMLRQKNRTRLFKAVISAP